MIFIIEISKKTIQAKADLYKTTYVNVSHNLQRYLGISDWEKKEAIENHADTEGIQKRMLKLAIENIKNQTGFHYEIMDSNGRIITNDVLGIRDFAI
jgi:hypothetical protein